MQGERVGSYVITELLGQGGMGAVYLAEHELLHRQAAIKMLLPAVSADPEVVDRFFDEARATTSINDPGIVQIFDFGYHTDGRAYLVMEHLEGETLDMRMEAFGVIDAVAALRITRQIATSLEAAHRGGVIHRDLKLENVFLVRDPAVAGGERAKILDFGIAKLQRRGEADVPRSHTRAGAIMGTPLYMSPEQCRDARDLDGRSDVYALGCLLFCMVTGRAPFDHASAGEIIAAHLKDPPPTPSAVNPRLDPAWAGVVDALVGRCLAKDPADRYQHMADLACAIGAALDDISGSHTLPPRAPTPLPAGSGTWTPLAVSPTLAAATPGSSLARPTTLSTSSGEARAQPGTRRWRGVVAGLALLALVVGAAGLALQRGLVPRAGGVGAGEVAVPGVPPPEPAAPVAAPAATTNAPVIVTVPAVILPPIPTPPPAAVAPAPAPIPRAPARSAKARSVRSRKGDPNRAVRTVDERPEDVSRGD